jgi:hypothetical protein
MTQNSVSDYQSSLALTEAVLSQGVFPPYGGGSAGGAFIGEIVTYAFGFDPGGMLAANGQTQQIASYTPLFSILGTNYGGNGTSNFAAPNLAGVTMVASGPAQG